MVKTIKNMLMVVAALVATTFVACNPDNGGENGGDPTPDTPEVIANNGVGADGKIKLNSVACAYYLGNVWDNGVADYYFMLTNDTLGMGSNGFEVPMHQGGWILYVDLWSVIAPNTADAVLPEGTYTFGNSRDFGCFYSEYSLATNNVEQVLVDGEWKYRVKDIFFQSGTVTVKHTSKGYLIETSVITTAGEELNFVYEGAIAFEDQSDDEEWRPALDKDIDLTPMQGSIRFYESYASSNCDNYVIMLFNTDKLSSDKMHPNVAGGIRLVLDIYPELGKGVTGSYKIGTLSDDKYLLKKEPWVYYPGCYWGTMALGTFVEYVDTDGSVLYSVVKSGDLDITDNGDGTYTIAADFVTERSKKITCNWTGSLETFVAR